MIRESEIDWRAREDAHALAQAEEIKQDPDRLQKAKDEARKLAEDKREEAKRLNKAAGSKATGFKPKGSSRKKSTNRSNSKGQDNKSPSKFNVFQRI